MMGTQFLGMALAKVVRKEDRRELGREERKGMGEGYGKRRKS